MFKKILFGMSALAMFAACTEDYTDWAMPQSIAPVEAQPASLSMLKVEPQYINEAIDLASEELANVEEVKLFTAQLPNNAKATSYTIKLTDTGNNEVAAKYDDWKITADETGCVKKADLQAAVEGMFGKGAVERSFNAVVATDLSVEGKTGTVAVAAETEPFVLTVIPVAPEFEEFIYVPGNGQGWAPDKAAGLYCANNDGIYTGYAYIDGDFKFTKHRNWDDGEYNWENFTTVPAGWTQGGGTNINCPEAGVFYLTVDILNLTIEATKIEYMGITGDYCGWNEGAEMTWNVDDCCYELSNAAVTANGWKFRANGLTDSTWAINLGGNDSVEPSNNIGDLVGGGKNLGVVGTTIKLYPLRNTSDKIYCTVE